jgi:hypothetical protein
MSSTHKYDLAGAKLLGSAKVTINSATTTSFDFGTPDDLNLAALANYQPGDRVLVVMTASTAGTTDALTWVIEDAPDSSGSIGTTAAASLSAIGSSALSAGTGDDFSAFAVKVQPGRPWLRCRVTRAGTTDTHVTHCTVWAIPSNL